VVVFALPVNLVDSVRADRSPERDAWLAALSGVVADFAGRWALRLGPPYQPGGRCAWVAPARDRTGRDLVLKVAWTHEEARHEADGLRAWAGNGAVLVHDSGLAEATMVLLLERCHPGTTLSQALPEPEQDEIVAGLLRRLWRASTGGYRFRPLQAMCDAWADEFDQRLAAGSRVLDPGLARAGVDLWRILPATADRQALLCTDLHAGNVLAAQREPWLMIDPKPYLGDPAYDTVQHMLNCDRLTTDPARLAHRMAGLLDLDPHRLRAWLFARCVLESLDQPHLREIVTRLAA
jgi:streptomycin 6-kinase